MGSSRPPRSTNTASCHAGRTAEVVQLVDDRADGAAGEQHVIDQQDVACRQWQTAGGWRRRGRRPCPRCAEVVAVQGAGDHAVHARQTQVGLQFFSQPGAARPDAHQRPCRACSKARCTPVQQFAVQRLRRPGSRCSWLKCSRKNCSRIMHGRGCVGVLGGTAGQGLGGGVALVHLVHRQTQAAMQLAGKTLGAPGVVVRRAPSGWYRHAHHQGVGLPFACTSFVDRGKTCIPLDGDGASAACPWRSRAVARWPRPPVCVPKSKARKEDAAARPEVANLGAVRSLMRAPPPATEHARVYAQQRPARLLVALRPSGVSKMTSGVASTVSQPLRLISSSSWPARPAAVAQRHQHTFWTVPRGPCASSTSLLVVMASWPPGTAKVEV